MIWPTIVVDNFFEEPQKIVDISKKLNFNPALDGAWPGKRSDEISTVDFGLFNYVNYKILRILYPMNHEKLRWTSNQWFQKIDGNIYKHKGWVHFDGPAELTAIIYLSHHKKCGTSLFEKKKFFHKVKHEDKKKEMYLNVNNMNYYSKYLKENNDQFEESLSIESRFNRLIMFDSNQAHAAQSFIDKDQENEDRLTYIVFFGTIETPGIKYPLTEMRRDF